MIPALIPEAGEFLRALFRAAVDAAQPESCLPPHLPPPPAGRTVVVGAGKAAASMARVVERGWTGPISGAVVVPYGDGIACEGIDVLEASHPVPDEAGIEAAKRLLDAVSGLGPDDLVLALISGGGSALLPLPAPGLTLADKQAVNIALLRSGAPIADMNCVRKHLSGIKGGRLGAACAPAQLVTLIISDVPDDDPATVASGPTIPDPTTLADARAALQRHRIQPPDAVAACLTGAGNETPKPDDAAFAAARTAIVARASDALAAAADMARKCGAEPVIIGEAVEGEARNVGEAHAALALMAAKERDAGSAPLVLLSGGETTVTLDDNGGDEGARGGPNTEYLLALGLALEDHPAIAAIACDTDGKDGSADAAGAVWLPDSPARGTARDIDAKAALSSHASFDFFSAAGDLVVTGPTHTNINDFRAIVIGAGTT